MPSPEFDNWIDSQYGYESYALEGSVTDAANIRFGDNPPYAVADFQAFYSQFSVALFPLNGSSPNPILQTFVNLANATVSQVRWEDAWLMGMNLFVAHFATLYLQSLAPTDANAKTVVSMGLAKGIQVSKAVADVSVSYQPIVTGWEQWGSWNLTTYGQQFITFAKMIGAGPMYIW